MHKIMSLMHCRYNAKNTRNTRQKSHAVYMQMVLRS